MGLYPFPLQKKPDSNTGIAQPKNINRRKGYVPFIIETAHEWTKNRQFTEFLPPFPKSIPQWMQGKTSSVPKKHLGLNCCHFWALLFAHKLVCPFPEILGKHVLHSSGMNFSQCYTTVSVNKALWYTACPQGTQDNWKAQNLMRPCEWRSTGSNLIMWEEWGTAQTFNTNHNFCSKGKSNLF